MAKSNKSQSINMNKRDGASNEGKEKVHVEVWVSIANLILTAIIGIGMAIFLKYRDEQIQKDAILLQAQVQKEIIAMQATLESDNNSAHLEISKDCLYWTSCDGTVTIKNTGPGDAKNVHVTINIDDISDDWREAVKDISVFKLKKFPPSLKINSNTTRVDTLYNFIEIEGDNAFEISIDLLPKGGEFSILLSLNDTVPTKKASASRPVTFYDTPDLGPLLLDVLDPFVESIFPIASFAVDSTCENCDGKSITAHFIMSSIYKTGSEKFNTDGDTTMFNLTTIYLIPEDLPNHEPNTSPLYIKYNDSEGVPTVEQTGPR